MSWAYSGRPTRRHLRRAWCSYSKLRTWRAQTSIFANFRSSVPGCSASSSRNCARSPIGRACSNRRTFNRKSGEFRLAPAREYDPTDSHAEDVRCRCFRSISCSGQSPGYQALDAFRRRRRRRAKPNNCRQRPRPTRPSPGSNRPRVSAQGTDRSYLSSAISRSLSVSFAAPRFSSK